VREMWELAAFSFISDAGDGISAVDGLLRNLCLI